MKTEEALIQEYLLTHLGPKALDGTLIEQNTENQPLYHVSTNPNITKFIPYVTNRRLKGETASIPRLSTAKSIGKCWMGYGGFWEGNTDEKWNGLFTVYEVEWDYCVKPHARFVRDVNQTDERWLIYYKPDQFFRKGKKVAEYFVKKLMLTPRKDYNDEDYIIFMRVLEDGVTISPNLTVKKGCYRIQLNNFVFPYYRFALDEECFIESITDKQYQWGFSIRSEKHKG